jgi:hypothetical protein
MNSKESVFERYQHSSPKQLNGFTISVHLVGTGYMHTDILSSLDNLIEQLANNLMSDRCDPDLPSVPDKLADHPSPRECLARARRPLDRQ